MKRLSIILLSIIIATTFVSAQTIVPFTQYNYWGYKDSKGQVVLKPQYELACHFKKGMALVKSVELDDDMMRTKHFQQPCCRWIDTLGNTVIGDFVEAWDFTTHDLALVRKEKLFGFIDRQGKVVIDFQYTQATPFDSYGMSDVTLPNNKCGRIDTANQVVMPIIYDKIINHQTCIITKKGNITGVYDRRNKPIIPEQFKRIEPIINSYINLPFEYGPSENEPVAHLDGYVAFQNGKYGLLDTLGKAKTKFIYDSMRIVYNQWIIVKRSGKYGLLNIDGKIKVPFVYDELYLALTGYGPRNWLFYVQRDGKYGAVTQNGYEIIPAHYEQCYNDGDEDVVKFIKDGQIIMFDHYGSYVGIFRKSDRWWSPIYYFPSPATYYERWYIWHQRDQDAQLGLLETESENIK